MHKDEIYEVNSMIEKLVSEESDILRQQIWNVLEKVPANELKDTVSCMYIQDGYLRFNRGLLRERRAERTKAVKEKLIREHDPKVKFSDIDTKCEYVEPIPTPVAEPLVNKVLKRFGVPRKAEFSEDEKEWDKRIGLWKKDETISDTDSEHKTTEACKKRYQDFPFHLGFSRKRD